ncbi:MAG TPA: fibronectin type III domain-containing protein [Spirochaetota bacterium]|jgi:hypothetical protein|nr:fibronectin type III domain-containing protein [Spirochaetota bacterium]HPJ13878.1 fibronectin type III domain-containing protein [Spirochaetota bacterium]HPM33591.1 fibronectin type III domain-containing protein [Spirochaetota bacterium]HPY02640.1 fibronectin type III domain-containing protein [Spirochaetota bacterium]HQA52522.1 fibronectin type III domain-containing protein [Spirochaetota bacterium]
MGKINFDPIVNNMSRKLGNFVYSSWKGINVVKPYNKHSVSQSQKQIEVRNAFAEASALWKALPQKIKDSWVKSVYGIAMTERNMFMKMNCIPIRNGNPGQISFANGAVLPQSINATSVDAGSIKITYSETAAPHLNAVMIKINQETGTLDSPQFIYDLSASDTEAEIKNLESNATYYLYVIAAETTFDKCERLSESAGYKIKVS